MAILENIDGDLISLYNQGQPLVDTQLVDDLVNYNLDLIVPLLGGK